MQEHHEPPRIEPKSLGDYLEVMSKAVFQSGISWRVVESKWSGIREAFRGFDAQAVAALGVREIDELATDSRVIRNRRKIEAIVGNANRIIALDRQHGSFRDYLRSQGSFEATNAALRKEFKFLGDSGVYYFLWVVGEQVPPYEEWSAARSR